MLLNEFFGKAIDAGKKQALKKDDDNKMNDDVFWFILDHDRLHKEYFHPLASNIKKESLSGKINKEKTVANFMPMVEKGCLEYYHKNKMKGKPAKLFPKEMREELCEKLYDHFVEDITKDKYKLKEGRLMEGGNVFAGKTTAIKKENIKFTLDAYFSELKSLFPNKASIFDEDHFHPLGSTYKKDESNDIDLGVSALDILDKEMSDESISQWGIDPAKVATEFTQLQKRARTSTPEQLRMKAFLKLLTLHINENAPTLYTDEKKVTDGNIFGLFPQIDGAGKHVGSGVQIDWMIGNLKWLKFSYHSAPYPKGSNVKGLHRTQLMLSAFQVAGLSFNHVTGVKDKDTGKVIAHDPDQALSILGQRLGFKISQADAEDYYRLHNLLKTKMKPSDYNTLLNVYFKILDSTRADIPDDMQDEWRQRKDLLGLTGKFLPDNSALKVLQ
jgi:hypothetical protein